MFAELMDTTLERINQPSTGLSTPDTDTCIAHVIEQTRTTDDSWIWITFTWIDDNLCGWNQLPGCLRYEWLTGHFLPELIMQTAEGVQHQRLTDACHLAEQFLAILRACKRIPDDTPVAVATMVRDAVDLDQLYDVRAYLSGLDSIREWSNGHRYNWNFFAWASGREISAFEAWTVRDWDDIREHCNRLIERIRQAIDVPISVALVDGSAAAGNSGYGYGGERPAGVGPGPMVTLTDVARMFKAMRDANILTATWDEIARFIGAGNGRTLAALASKPNSASPRVVRLLEILLDQCHPDEREMLRTLL